MSRVKKPSTLELDNMVNPFVFTLDIPVVKMEDTSRFSTGSDGIILHDVITLEYDKSVKVYVSSARRKVLNELSPNSCKLLNWIEQELDSNKDYFWLNKQRYMDETGVAYNTYKKSTLELQSIGIIAQSPIIDVFWINPHYIFCGNRVRKYKEKIRVVREKMS